MASIKTMNNNTTTDMPLSSKKYTLLASKDSTLEEIARKEKISIDELLGANPALSATQKLNQDQKIFLPVIQKLIEDTAVGVSKNDSEIVPDTFSDQVLDGYKQRLRDFFVTVDENESGQLDIAQFNKLLLERLNLRTLDDLQILTIYFDICGSKDDGLTFDDIFNYLRSIIVVEKDLSIAQLSLFEAMLITDHLNECILGGITQFLNQTWSEFSHFKRYGRSGNLVMTSGESVAVVTEGKYSLVDLIFWPDQLTENIVPKHAVIKGFQWHSKSEFGPDAKAGELIFPSSFDRTLPSEIATVQTLKYYGCCFANETQLKVSLIHRHEIVDFQYLTTYLNDFVQGVNHPGLERHAFAHLDCPHDDYTKNGRFILGKIVNNDELHLTAFIIPPKHTLYVPPHTIHSNDYLRGTWRTMLAEADIDRAILKRQRSDGNLPEIFSFDFS